MIWLCVLASPWLLGGALIVVGFIFYPWHEDMLDVAAWVWSQF